MAEPSPSHVGPAEDGDQECPICLGVQREQSMAKPDCCDHVFCSGCLQKWQKTSTPARCPLCKSNFSDIRAVKACSEPARYPRDKTDLLLPPYSLKKDLVFHFDADDFCFSRGNLWHARKKASSRAWLYCQAKHVLPPSVVGCEGVGKLAPGRLEYDGDVLSDLKKWIHRELRALLNKPVLEDTVDSFITVLKRSHPLCLPFENQLKTILGDRTSHFIHELYNYMVSPFNIVEYDSYAAFGPLEIVSTLELTINHARENLPRDLVEAEHLSDFIKEELHFDKFKAYFPKEKNPMLPSTSKGSIDREEHQRLLLSKTQTFVICLQDISSFGPQRGSRITENRRQTPYLPVRGRGAMRRAPQ